MEINMKALFKGSLILLIAFNLFNLLNFLFQFSMARLLSLADYGILASLFAIIYIFAAFSESIQTVITKYTAKEKNSSKLKNILKRTFKKSLKISLAFFIFYLVLSIFLSPLLKIPYTLLALNGLMIIGVFLTPITRGIIQGRKQFTALGLNVAIEGAIKLSLAISFVLIGWKIYGALAGTIIAIFIAFIISLYPLKDIINSKEKTAKTKDIYQYTTPVFILTLIILVFYSIDVIMAKIMFPSNLAGAYALASTLAKTIFFATHPISKAMFPIIAGKHPKARSKKLFLHSLLMLLFCVIIALFFFFFFPDLLIRIFSGRYIPEASSIIFPIAISIALISISNLTILYKLSLSRTKGYLNFIIFPAIEIFLLWHFSQNLMEFALAFLVSSALFLFASVIFPKK